MSAHFHSKSLADAVDGTVQQSIAVPIQQMIDGKQVYVLVPANYIQQSSSITVAPDVDDATTIAQGTVSVERHVQTAQADPLQASMAVLFEDDNDDDELGLHTASAPPPLTFSCSLCDYTSHKRYMLKRHMKSHSEDRPFTCPTCARGFKTCSALKNHTDIHDGIKRFACSECPMRFVTSGELHRHERYRHRRDDRPHACPMCPFVSVETSKLRRHMRAHTGERPYKCDECTYAAADAARLRRHQRVHNGEKPYTCDVCGLHFAQGNTMTAHRATHAVRTERRLFACDVCGRQLTRATDLRNHKKRLHTAEPTPCTECDATCADRHALRAHRKLVHLK